MYKKTYSVRKPNNEIIKAEINHQNDLLFNEIVLKGASSDDSPSRPHKQPKAKNNADREHASKSNRKRNLVNSFELFKDNFWGGKKDRYHGSKHSVDKRAKLKEISSMIGTLSDSEGAGHSGSRLLVEDTCSEGPENRPKVKIISNLQSQPPEENASSQLELEELSLNESIEIARESKVFSSRWSAKGLHSSPPVKVVHSDDDSFSSSHQSGSQENKLASSGQNWVTISSDTKGTGRSYTDTWSRSSQKMSQSKYTYSFVSTYTDNTGKVTSKASSNDRTSPHIVLKKLKPKLNSTTCWNKDDIGTVQFPDFISPIIVKPIASYGQIPMHDNQIAKTKDAEKVDKNHDPKSSSPLFVSISSSQTKMLPSLSLSAIKEASKVKVEVDVHHQEESTQKSYDTQPTLKSYDTQPTQKFSDIQPTLVEPSQDTIKADKEVERFKSSTPHNQNVPLTLDLSPIKSPIFDDDELCINYSVEENTDEIIVPSLDQLSHLSDDSSPPMPFSDNEVNILDESKEECDGLELCSGDDGDNQNQNQQKQVKLNPVIQETLPDQIADPCSSMPSDHLSVNGAKNALGKEVDKKEKSVKGDKNMKCAEIKEPLNCIEIAQCDKGAEIGVKGVKAAQCVKGDKMARPVKGAKPVQSEKSGEMAQSVSGAKSLQSEKSAEMSQSVKGANNNQSVKGANNTQSVIGANNIQSAKRANNEQSVKSANNVQSMKSANNAQFVKGANNAQSSKSALNAQSAKSANNEQSVKSANIVQSMKGANNAQSVKGANNAQSAKSANNSQSAKSANNAQSAKSANNAQSAKNANNAQYVKGVNTTDLDCVAYEDMFKTFLNQGSRKKKGNKNPLLNDSEDTDTPDNNVFAEKEALETNIEQNCCEHVPIQSPVGDEELEKQDSGCSKCISHFNRGLLRGVCFVSKLCISSQSILKNGQ